MENGIRVKTIEQDSFDEVVKENVTEFEMELNEAIEDAIAQFTSQEVELSNIVKTMKLGVDGEVVHNVVSAIDNLKSIHNLDAMNDLLKSTGEIDIIGSECDKGIAYRILAAKNNAYSVLMSCFIRFKHGDQVGLKSSLCALISLTDGQPDLFESEDMPLFHEIFSLYEKNPYIILLLLKLIRNFCLRHEINRQEFIKSGIVSPIIEILSVNTTPELVCECCIVLRVFTFDDDIRVPYGKAHDHAKLIASEYGSIKLLSSLISKFKNNSVVIIELLSTLSKLAVRNEFCQEVMEENGLRYALGALLDHVDNQNLVKNSLLLIKTTAGNDDVRRSIIECGGAPSILNAIQRYINRSAAVVEIGCTAIAMLAMRNPNNCDAIMQFGGASIIIQAMTAHSDHLGIQKQSCMAIRNLVARTRKYQAEFIDQGVEDLINRARSKHSIEDAAKAALRDLGCKVELKELWKGEHGDICK